MSLVLTGANRHVRIAAMDLIVSVMVKRPVHKEQHLCADKAYDAKDVRESIAVKGYEDHIKVNPRKTSRSDEEELDEKEGSDEL